MTIRVLISYSHDSEEYMRSVLELSDRLRNEGIDCQIDQYEQSPVGGWTRWMHSEIKQADFVLVACTETYAKRFDGEAEPGTGLGATWEGMVITQQLYESSRRTNKFVPILPSRSDEEHIPVSLKGLQAYFPFEEEGYEALYRLLTNQPEVVKPEVKKVRSLSPKKRQMKFASESGTENVIVSLAETTGQGQQDPPGDPGTEVPDGPVPSNLRWIMLAAFALVILLAYIFKDRIFPNDEDDIVIIPPPRSQAAFIGTHFPDMPFYLRYTINHHDFLYWLSLEGTNPTDEPLHVEVRCTILNEPKQAECGKNPTRYTIQPKETSRQIIDPHLEILAPDSFKTPINLDIAWIVKDEKGNTKWQGTHKVNVTPKTQFHWPLVNSAGEPVDPEFLLASLAAWTKTNESDDTYRLGEALLDESASMDDFMRRVYEQVLKNPDRVKRVFPEVRALPPQNFITFQMPKQLMKSEKKEAHPVEAALLVGAITQKANAAFAGHVAAVMGKPQAEEHRPILIAWKTAGSEWKSFDLTTLALGFEENTRSAGQLLEAEEFNATALSKIDEKGVYFDAENLRFVIDFQRAAEFYQIEPLP